MLGDQVFCNVIFKQNTLATEVNLMLQFCTYNNNFIFFGLNASTIVNADTVRLGGRKKTSVIPSATTQSLVKDPKRSAH